MQTLILGLGIVAFIIVLVLIWFTDEVPLD